MNLWPTYTSEMEGTLFIVDRKENIIILIIEQVFGESSVIYKPDEIESNMEEFGVTINDVLKSEMEELDASRDIWRAFFEA